MHEELTRIRGELDRIDRQMVELFKERMELSSQVAAYKREHDLPILVASRERELLAKVAEQAGMELADYTQVLYRTLLAVSRAYQHARLGVDSELYNDLQRTLHNTPIFHKQLACPGLLPGLLA